MCVFSTKMDANALKRQYKNSSVKLPINVSYHSHFNMTRFSCDNETHFDSNQLPSEYDYKIGDIMCWDNANDAKIVTILAAKHKGDRLVVAKKLSTNTYVLVKMN